MIKSHSKLELGDRVQAKIRVYDLPGDNFGPPHPRAIAKYGAFAAHIHAEPGELGFVVGLDDDRVQVRFDRTQTSTDVVAEEVAHVPTELCMHHWKNVLHTLSPHARRLTWQQLGELADALGYFYYVWSDRVLVTKAAKHRPLDSWPLTAEFFVEE